ncbi:MAG: hydroxyacid dehydrogenase [Planctomycetota bacterium]
MNRYQVLISDPLPADARRILEASGRIDVHDKHKDYEALLPGIHGWIVRSGTTVTKALLEKCPALTCICRAGAGVDNVDVATATERRVVVMNTPGGNANAAAELSITLLLALVRKVPFAHASMAKGGWDRKLVGIEVEGKRLGVLGLGKVGRVVARKARGLGMQVIGVDPFVTADDARALGITMTTLEEMLPSVDFLSLHTPLNNETRNMFAKERFSAMKRGAYIVNVSRGGVIDETALLAALEAGQLSGAALDVFATEPLPADSPLRNHPKIVLTPHLGAGTVEAQDQVAFQSAEQIRDYLLSGKIANSVNAAKLGMA